MVKRYDAIALGLLKKEEERMANGDFFTSRCEYNVNHSDDIHSFDWKSAIEHDGGVCL